MKKQLLKFAALFMAAAGFAPWAKADTDILTEELGYAKVTAMPENLSDYYFIIVDKDKDLMMTLEAGSQQGSSYKTWWYRTSVDPSGDLNRVWMIEDNNGYNGYDTDGYAFRNVNESTYLMQTEYNAAYYFRTHDQPEPCEWTQFIFNYDAEGDYWTFENGKYPMSSDAGYKGYVGPWEQEDDPIQDGAETAANKQGDYIGKFVIYSILIDDFNNQELVTKRNTALAEISDTYQSIADHSEADDEVKAVYVAAISTATETVTNAESVEAIEAALEALESARQTYVQNAVPADGYPFDMTFLIVNADCSSTDGWTTTGTVGANSSQHWSGSVNVYIEPCNWSASSWDCGISQTITLPNGYYELKAAGRASIVATISLFANNDTIAFDSYEDVGGTIATDGTEWASIEEGLAAGKTFANNNAGRGWNYKTLEITVSDKTLTLGATSSSDSLHTWCSIDDFQLLFVGGIDQELEEEIDQELVAAREAALAEISDTYQSIADHSEADDEVKAVYVAAISTATETVTNAESVEAIEAALEALESARQTYVQNAVPADGYPFDMTFLIVNADCSSTDGWTTTGTVGANSSQHWSGSVNVYIEPCNWSASSWDCGISQTITLPNGYYELKAAGRASIVATISLFANNDTIAFDSYEDVGGTIATDGTEWASIEEGLAAGKTFANNNAGRGWNYKTLEVTVGGNSLTLGATSSSSTQYTWCSIDDFQLLFVSGIADDEQLEVAKAALKDLLDQAEDINITANVGTAAFQIPESAVDAFDDAFMDADNVYALSEDVTEVENAIAALQAAIESYQNVELNEPAEGERFNVIMASSWEYSGYAVTFVGGRTDGMGEYSLGYYSEPNANYAQSFIMEKADEGVNCYLMSFIGTDGQTYYVCTGTVYEGTVSQIRTTTDRSLALPIQVIATSTDGVHYLRNTVADQYIGGQDSGFFTVYSHIDFNIQTAEEAEVELEVTEEEWATLMLPYDAEVPEGLTAYTYAGTEMEDDGTVRLTLEEAGEQFAANTPYIIKGTAGTYAFSGYGLATQDTYTAGGMTGTLAGLTAEAGSYVLQNQDGVNGFYRIETGSETTVAAYQAYIDAETASEAGLDASALILPGEDTATGIADVVAGGDQEKVSVYSINGVLLRKNVKAGEALQGLQKGIYIVNGQKKAVK